ncbi:hypothetical protein AMAG_16931 [Allomyces macrogynus ATCC 38327]|uniref:Uncharacterized protein n=1 Tax=Allomyces macrogynus (strain ATCC 38327) TaxID=578462 RepID=A0A0L0TDR9_ALLM3|nr:hypothetical protein AMAG_16931 [Allomyces macrogynus ATCC 38327]|eukprot:KNE72826.1 hypothetical protein AMAG_16931 [Allomyces macrogynus ATCC 38327]
MSSGRFDQVPQRRDKPALCSNDGDQQYPLAMPPQSLSMRAPARPCAATATTAIARPSRPRRATTRAPSAWKVLAVLVLALVALGHIAMGPILAAAKKSSLTTSDTLTSPTITSSKVDIILPTFSISLTGPNPLFPAPAPTALSSSMPLAANQTEATPTLTPTTTARKATSTSSRISGSLEPTEDPEPTLLPHNRVIIVTPPQGFNTDATTTSTKVTILKSSTHTPDLPDAPEAPTVDDPTADTGRDAPMPAVVSTVPGWRQTPMATTFPTGWDMLVQIGGGQSAVLAQNAAVPAPANRRGVPAVVAKSGSGSAAAAATPTPTARANLGPGQTSPNSTDDDDDGGTGRLTSKKNGTALTDDGIAATCGNGQCDVGETCTNCWADCGVVVGNMLIACDLGWQRCKNPNKTVLIMTNQTNENAPLPTDLLKQYPIHVVTSGKQLTVYPFLQPDANLTYLDAHPGITSLVYVATAGNLNATVSWFVGKGWRIVSARECRVGADRAPLIWDNPLSLDMSGVKADDVEASVIAEQGRLLLKSLLGGPPESRGARSVEWGAVGWSVVLAAAVVRLA